MAERKSGSQAGGAEPSPDLSKRSYSARLDEDLLAQLRASPKEARQQIGEAIRTVQENFGRPHQHSGIGIRDLAPKGSGHHLYERRLSKSVRLVFALVDVGLVLQNRPAFGRRGGPASRRAWDFVNEVA